jgi:hypothetical protein
MKTAIYVEQGITQLVLTPQNDWEKNIIKAITTGEQTVQIKRGSFYECRGGWVRFEDSADDASLILVAGVNAIPTNPQ